jgi:hypothetical protein
LIQERNKPYLTYGEVNDLIPHDVDSSEVLDDLLVTIGTQGMDALEGQPRLRSGRLLLSVFPCPCDLGSRRAYRPEDPRNGGSGW